MRRRLSKDVQGDEKVGHYFLREKKIKFFSSGCLVLDLVLGGGWPLGRISNVVGDFGAAKTLLAIEACANFHNEYKKGKIYYLEAEAAFDIDYAKSLGLPLSEVELIEDTFTVGGMFSKLSEVVNTKTGHPNLFIVDSLDALEVSEESKKDLNEAGFSGARKAGKMSEVFRKITSHIKNSDTHLMIISQVRDKIGVMFGEKKTRSGGKALDFYASQILWLSVKKKKKSTIRGIERVTGIEVRANCKKNKVGLPFRQCDFDVVFGYGVDDVMASLVFLKGVKGSLQELGIEENKISKVCNELKTIKDEKLLKSIREKVSQVWNEIETSFLPTSSKYR